MKVALIVLIVVLMAALIGWMRAGEKFPLVQTAPFLGGYAPGLYDVAALAMIIVTVCGLMRMRRDDDDA